MLHLLRLLTIAVSKLWPFLDLKIHQETDLISELRLAQTKLNMKIVTQYALLCLKYFFAPPCYVNGKWKKLEIFYFFAALIKKSLLKTS